MTDTMPETRPRFAALRALLAAIVAHAQSLLEVAAVALIVAGVALWSLPVALIVAGVAVWLIAHPIAIRWPS